LNPISVNDWHRAAALGGFMAQRRMGKTSFRSPETSFLGAIAGGPVTISET